MFRACLLVLLGAPALSSCGLFLGGAECAGDADCFGSKICVAGQCAECRTDSDCDVNEACTDGTCLRGAGEGEGEGQAGEGEGEGEGQAGEGEGEGEGQLPTAALSFELLWDQDVIDVDLHVTEGTPFCVSPTGTTSAATPPVFGPFSQSCVSAPLDCNYSNCTGPPSPDWDGNGTASAADPVHDLDDTNGLGPEITSVQAPVAGVYLAGAAYYSAGFPPPSPIPSTQVTLTVRARGLPAKVIRGTLATEGSWADLAIVHVTDTGQFCVGDVTDGVDECP